MEKIIFVYNANSGFLNALTETVHKTISPSTYQCNLCSITYGKFNMKEDWKKFIKNLKYKTEFLHKDEFLKKYGKSKHDFPIVFIKKNKDLKLFISKKEINSVKSIDELKDLVHKRLKSFKK